VISSKSVCSVKSMELNMWFLTENRKRACPSEKVLYCEVINERISLVILPSMNLTQGDESLKMSYLGITSILWLHERRCLLGIYEIENAGFSEFHN
jgi:hypothetical protein